VMCEAVGNLACEMMTFIQDMRAEGKLNSGGYDAAHHRLIVEFQNGKEILWEFDLDEPEELARKAVRQLNYDLLQASIDLQVEFINRPQAEKSAS
jgi:hypothetical protein